MKKLIKVIYYLLNIFFALELFMFTFRSQFTDIAIDIMSTPYMQEVFMGLTALIVIVSIVRIIMIALEKSDDRYMNLYEDSGLICISEDAIKNCASKSLDSFEEVLEKTIKVKIKNKSEDESDIVVNIKCGLDEENSVKMGMNELCGLIQAKVHNNLEDFLSSKVNKVNIKFYNIRKKDIVKPKKDEKKDLNKKHLRNKKKKRVN